MENCSVLWLSVQDLRSQSPSLFRTACHSALCWDREHLHHSLISACRVSLFFFRVIEFLWPQLHDNEWTLSRVHQTPPLSCVCKPLHLVHTACFLTCCLSLWADTAMKHLASWQHLCIYLFLVLHRMFSFSVVPNERANVQVVVIAQPVSEWRHSTLAEGLFAGSPTDL